MVGIYFDVFRLDDLWPYWSFFSKHNYYQRKFMLFSRKFVILLCRKFVFPFWNLHDIMESQKETAALRSGWKYIIEERLFFGKIKTILQFFFYDRDVYNQVLKVCKNNSQKLSTLSRAIYFMNYDQCRMITNIFILS